ncbi:MAG: FHA domain-containing protein [Deltaproteobacteria bacterium]|nr:FHA domain-containing protein [Deltaproteobacteria bacterium]
MGVFTIKKGFHSGAIFRLGQRNLTIGRDPGNLIQLIDDKISRRHCMIKWLGGADYYLVDLHSHNGTQINGMKTAEKHLAYGDIVQVGDTVLEFNKDTGAKKDSTLEPKVVDRKIVAVPTQTVERVSQIPVVIQPGKIVDTDKLHEMKEERAAFFLYELTIMLSRGTSLANELNKTADEIFKFLSPDRLFILQFGEENKLKTLVSKVREDLTEAGKKTKPDILMVSSASAKSRRSSSTPFHSTRRMRRE